MRIFLLWLAILLGSVASAQSTRGFYPWWDGPITSDLEVNPVQKEQVQAIVRSYRTKLGAERAAAIQAEDALEAAFNVDAVDEARVHEGIRELAAARQNVFITVSEMSLKLRMVLTPVQWRELQRRRSERAQQRNPRM